VRTIGIDVGGTNTDAVLLIDSGVKQAVKTPTTPDVTSGICNALMQLRKRGDVGERVDAVMIGTTHFVNAVIQRQGLGRVAAVRIGLPVSASLEPFIDWPADLAAIVRGSVHMVAGGHEYDGKPIVPFDYTAMRRAAEEIAEAGIHSAVVTSIFSALNPECELEAARVLREICPRIDITLSHELGRIGLLERENAALLNAALKDLAGLTIKAFEQALAESGINAPLFLSQNDGTIARAEHASAFPILSFASGPTNSMRGAAFLSNLSDAVVIDVGGTSTDVGCLHCNFPREANNAVQICGVRTLFRMPDLFSIGLGGGSIVNRAPLRIGPDSVGFRLTEKAVVFGGSILTLSDVGVASGLIELGDRRRLDQISSNLIADTMAMVQQRIGEAADRMKPDAAPLPLIAVGGGSFLVPPKVPGFSEVVRVEHYAVANAVGAAISQVSGGIDRIFSGISRDEALRQAEELAKTKAVEAGANGSTLELVEIEDLPLAYLPGNTLRVHARVIGRLG